MHWSTGKALEAIAKDRGIEDYAEDVNLSSSRRGPWHRRHCAGTTHRPSISRVLIGEKATCLRPSARGSYGRATRAEQLRPGIDPRRPRPARR
jgi:hypothetical protein